jgi:hypothetical protein
MKIWGLLISSAYYRIRESSYMFKLGFPTADNA